MKQLALLALLHAAAASAADKSDVTRFSTSAGFEVENGVAGMPTVFVASHGSGEPVVAFLAEFDATRRTSVTVATWVPGTSAHGWQAVAAGGVSIGFKGMTLAAKVLATTALDLYETPSHLETAKRELETARGPDIVYRSLIGDRAPPLDYRR